MPKVFLVKRRSPGVSVRSWDELPDEERADTYIPGERRAGAGPGRQVPGVGAGVAGSPLLHDPGWTPSVPHAPPSGEWGGSYWGTRGPRVRGWEPATPCTPSPLVGASNCPAAGPLAAAGGGGPGGGLGARKGQPQSHVLVGLHRDGSTSPGPGGSRSGPPISVPGSGNLARGVPSCAWPSVPRGHGNWERRADATSPPDPKLAREPESGARSPTPAALPTWRGAQVRGGAAAAAPPAGQTAAGARA